MLNIEELWQSEAFNCECPLSRSYPLEIKNLVPTFSLSRARHSLFLRIMLSAKRLIYSYDAIMGNDVEKISDILLIFKLRRD